MKYFTYNFNIAKTINASRDGGPQPHPPRRWGRFPPFNSVGIAEMSEMDVAARHDMRGGIREPVKTYPGAWFAA